MFKSNKDSILHVKQVLKQKKKHINNECTFSIYKMNLIAFFSIFLLTYYSRSMLHMWELIKSLFFSCLPGVLLTIILAKLKFGS